MKSVFILIFILCSCQSNLSHAQNGKNASTSKKVEFDVREIDQKISDINSNFSSVKENPKNTTWVKSKIFTMFTVDQILRNSLTQIPTKNRYNENEKKELNALLWERIKNIDDKNTTDLKILLNLYTWFRISQFGEDTDNQAWLLVQHADQDPVFQNNILVVLQKLWNIKETNPSNYAYLYDRVAASFSDPTKRKLQLYGTQGSCKSKGVWEPLPVENPDLLDKRRESVGLEPMIEYKKKFKDICI